MNYGTKSKINSNGKKENSYVNLQKFLPKRLKLIQMTLEQIQVSKVVLKRLTNTQIEKYTRYKKKIILNHKNNDYKEDKGKVVDKEKVKEQINVNLNDKNKVIGNENTIKAGNGLQTSHTNSNNYGSLITYKNYDCSWNIYNNNNNFGDEYCAEATIYYQCIICLSYGLCKTELLQHYESVHQLSKEHISQFNYQSNGFMNNLVFSKNNAIRRINCYHRCRRCHHCTLNLNHALHHANQLQNDFTCGSCSFNDIKSDLKNYPNWRQLIKSFLIISTTVQEKPRALDFTWNNHFLQNQWPIDKQNKIVEFQKSYFPNSRHVQMKDVSQNFLENHW